MELRRNNTFYQEIKETQKPRLVSPEILARGGRKRESLIFEAKESSPGPNRCQGTVNRGHSRPSDRPALAPSGSGPLKVLIQHQTPEQEKEVAGQNSDPEKIPLAFVSHCFTLWAGECLALTPAPYEKRQGVSCFFITFSQSIAALERRCFFLIERRIR